MICPSDVVLSSTPAFASLVIPYFKRADTIVRALHSAELSNDISEIIVVDDELSSHSKCVLNDLAQHFPKARVIDNTSIKGALGARVVGAHLARNDLIVFLDSDDELIPRGVSQCLDALQADSDLCLAYGNIFFRSFMSSVSNFLELTGYEYLKVLRNLSLCPFSGLCVRKSHINWDSLRCDLPAWQDDEFVLTASRAGKIQFVNCITAVMHDSGGGRISANKISQLTGLRMLLEKWGDEIIANFGFSCFCLWKLRELSIMLKIASIKIDNQRATASSGLKIVLRCCSFSIYVAQRMLGKAFEVYFDRVYA